MFLLKKKVNYEKRYKVQIESMFAVLDKHIETAALTLMAAQATYPTDDCPEVTEAKEVYTQTFRIYKDVNKAFFKVITDESLRKG
jgi:hypothetical protein